MCGWVGPTSSHESAPFLFEPKKWLSSLPWPLIALRLSSCHGVTPREAFLTSRFSTANPRGSRGLSTIRMDLKERIRRSPTPPTQGEELLAASPAGPRGGRKGRAVVLPLSAAALVACAVVLLLLAGGSAARRGQFVGADPTVLPSRGGGVGDLHLSQSKSNDGKKMKMVCLTVSIFFSVGVHSITPL